MKPLAGRRILVVDDEALLREILRDVFEHAGAFVMDAPSGRTAFEVLKKEIMDVVFSDARMPDGDGMDLMRKISSSLHYKPICFLCTGFSDVSKEEASRHGVLDILNKPFDTELIVGVVQKALAGA